MVRNLEQDKNRLDRENMTLEQQLEETRKNLMEFTDKIQNIAQDKLIMDREKIELQLE